MLATSDNGGIPATLLSDRTLKAPEIRPVEPIQRPGLRKGTITQQSGFRLFPGSHLWTGTTGNVVKIWLLASSSTATPVNIPSLRRHRAAHRPHEVGRIGVGEHLLDVPDGHCHVNASQAETAPRYRQ